jgi:segregation and condensation protein B
MLEQNARNHHLVLALEVVLLTRSEPVLLEELVVIFGEEGWSSHAIQSALSDLQTQWQSRGMNLVETALGWRFQSKMAFSKYLRSVHAERIQRFSRAAIETLTIIAYKQPVSRGDIENIRGVAVSSGILKSLEEKGWIKEIGHRNVPGKPALFGTTDAFLTDFGLSSLDGLPSV